MTKAEFELFKASNIIKPHIRKLYTWEFVLEIRKKYVSILLSPDSPSREVCMRMIGFSRTAPIFKILKTFPSVVAAESVHKKARKPNNASLVSLACKSKVLTTVDPRALNHGRQVSECSQIENQIMSLDSAVIKSTPASGYSALLPSGATPVLGTSTMSEK